MRRRNVLARFLTLMSLSLVVPGVILAATVHPELQEALSKKAGGLVPVLMVYDHPSEVSDLAPMLEGLSPSQRRTEVINALKSRTLETQRNAMAILDNPNLQNEVSNVTQLYFAGAIAFKANANVVATLGALPDQATLLLDKNYDLTSDTVHGAVGEPGKASRAIAWSVDYINADRVWNELGYTGDGIVVGHIDSGIDLDHPDLADRLWVNVDEIPVTE